MEHPWGPIHAHNSGGEKEIDANQERADPALEKISALTRARAKKKSRRRARKTEAWRWQMNVRIREKRYSIHGELIFGQCSRELKAGSSRSSEKDRKTIGKQTEIKSELQTKWIESYSIHLPFPIWFKIKSSSWLRISKETDPSMILFIS
jgi:hypothetical protein